MIPRINAYVVTVKGSYLVRRFFPTTEYIAQHNAERSISRQPIKKVLLKTKFSFFICARIIIITPKKESKIPIDFLKESFSFKKTVESSTIKITFVNHSTRTKEVVIGKIDRDKLKYFYDDNQGWIFIESDTPMVVYKFDIDKIYDCSRKKVFVVDKEKLQKHLEPVYITGIFREPHVFHNV